MNNDKNLMTANIMLQILFGNLRKNSDVDVSLNAGYLIQIGRYLYLLIEMYSLLHEA